MSSLLRERSALIVVDVQPDFMSGGPLACHQAEAILPGLAQLLASRHFSQVIATQDWHPPTHVSFADNHPKAAAFDSIELDGQLQTLWPVHCVAGSPGAALHPALDWAMVDLILRKGCRPDTDSYSAFRENFGPDGQRASTGLGGWLRERGVDAVSVCGLARDVCVLWTALDARAAGFDTQLIWDLSRPVSPAGDTATREACAQAGVQIV